MNHTHLFVVVVRVQVQIGPLSCLCFTFICTYFLSLSPSSALSHSKSQRKRTDIKPQQVVIFLLVHLSCHGWNLSERWPGVYMACEEFVCVISFTWVITYFIWSFWINLDLFWMFDFCFIIIIISIKVHITSQVAVMVLGAWFSHHAKGHCTHTYHYHVLVGTHVHMHAQAIGLLYVDRKHQGVRSLSLILVVFHTPPVHQRNRYLRVWGHFPCGSSG